LRRLLFLLLVGAVAPAAAQESASYQLREQVLNAGGHPAAGQGVASSSFVIRLDSIGEGLIATGLASESFRLDAGFAGAFPPAGEVQGLRFTSRSVFTWTSEPSAGTYNVYRGFIREFTQSGFGSCFNHDLTTNSEMDANQPTAGKGWFYLVTASNRLDEEGTKGKRSDGSVRSNTAPCP
jgi:hypothetical protein